MSVERHSSGRRNNAMSVALMLTYLNGHDDYIPLSGQRTYDEVIVPSAAKLGAVWLPLFSTGVPIDREDLLTVINEFERLTAYFEDTSDQPKEICDAIIARIEPVITALKRVTEDPTITEVWIG
jgi:hypothetical protein